MGRFALTNPLQLGQPIVNGQNVLSTQTPISAGASATPGIAISSNLISIQCLKFGTLTNDCTIDLEASIDGGSNYRKTGFGFTNAEMQMNAGFIKSVQVKATHVRFTINVGTMTGANGANVRLLD